MAGVDALWEEMIRSAEPIVEAMRIAASGPPEISAACEPLRVATQRMQAFVAETRLNPPRDKNASIATLAALAHHRASLNAALNQTLAHLAPANPNPEASP
jgi:hypothetical protein